MATASDVVYVLTCQHDTYYVGRTKDLDRRFREHQQGAGNGAEWTKAHPPVNVSRADAAPRPFEEERLVLELMKTHGIDKVRGGRFSQIELRPHQMREIYTIFASEANNCTICFRPGHYARDCRACRDCGRLNHAEECCFANDHVVAGFSVREIDSS